MEASQAARPPLMRWRVVVILATVSLAVAGVIVWLNARTKELMEAKATEGNAYDRIGANAPFITTPDRIVDEMVELADLSADDVVYDLGCGDGRIIITAALKSGCRGVGIDIDPQRVAEARENVKLHGVEHLVEIREQDVFTVDLRETDVVLMYLLPWMTKKLIPEFQRMRPGSRIVSHDFGLGDIKDVEPEKTVEIPSADRAPEHRVHRWIVPLQIKPPARRP